MAYNPAANFANVETLNDGMSAYAFNVTMGSLSQSMTSSSLNSEGHVQSAAAPPPRPGLVRRVLRWIIAMQRDSSVASSAGPATGPSASSETAHYDSRRRLTTSPALQLQQLLGGLGSLPQGG